jgi:hypothetical protein
MKALLLLAATAFANATIIPQLQPEERSIFERGLTSWGGWALLATTCPSGTSTCGTSSCCPTNYTCTTGKTSTPICCPTSTWLSTFSSNSRLLTSALNRCRLLDDSPSTQCMRRPNMGIVLVWRIFLLYSRLNWHFLQCWTTVYCEKSAHTNKYSIDNGIYFHPGTYSRY